MTENRVLAAETVARRWTELNAPFLVMHGLEGYPDDLGRDLDILMHPQVAAPALAEAALVLRELGWRTVCPPDLWGRRVVGLKGDTGDTLDYVELHTMGSLQWAALPLVLASEPPSGAIGPFPVSSWATFAKVVLTPLLAGDLSRFSTEYLESLGQAGVTDEVIVLRTTRLFGKGLAHQLASIVGDLDPEALSRLSRQLRWAAVRRMLGYPLGTARILPKFFWRKLERLGNCGGIRITLAFPRKAQVDGITECVADQLRHVFTSVSVEAGRSSTALDRVRQQYRILSRQGLVLELEDRPPDAANCIRATASCGMFPGWDPERSFPFTLGEEEIVGREIARWIVQEWRSRFQCRP